MEHLYHPLQISRRAHPSLKIYGQLMQVRMRLFFSGVAATGKVSVALNSIDHQKEFSKGVKVGRGLAGKRKRIGGRGTRESKEGGVNITKKHYVHV